eukprot:CAMPEP_0206034330 /NCGR_PEP_ID=MMETSP1466-20131121/1265_1 /ASSEMBLY_ACC=CAM_ASM_001126 /TAXON_ID=44452 /ORGANISM="Pavlova gyrans, Strain CCMP608" /LENGTH=319 /DNA_ID=CAMNT_0053408607 /DNA_START=50 /DNA_END=1010 /DNA_ORIENTATION=-
MGKDWVPAESSGWMWAHHAIRADFEDTLIILARMRDAPKIEPWEIDELKLWFARVSENVHHHHDNEEKVFFPKIRERVALPERLTADHKTMLAALTEADAAVNAIRSQSDVSKAYTKVKAVQDMMLPHLKEEEDDTLPAMMKQFTPKDFAPIEQKMVKAMAWYELPHFYRRLEDDFAAKRSHGVGHLGIPGFVFGGPIKKNMDRYDVEYGWYVHELKDPALKPKYDNLRMQYHAKKAAAAAEAGRGLNAHAIRVGSGSGCRSENAHDTHQACHDEFNRTYEALLRRFAQAVRRQLMTRLPALRAARMPTVPAPAADLTD